ncbi:MULTISPECIES: hypothetical protein [Mycolicibacterium]|nr:MULTISPECIES: hypothetical protein [Mycolicibacterium]MCV7129800.1 hypothetical protein [Mycolicibacterium vanbaalenii PYR-1]QZY44291.1 hypothetical protein K5L12_18545 [Mycolicibacterium austroafricanum]
MPAPDVGPPVPLSAPLTAGEAAHPTIAAGLQQPRTLVASRLGFSELDREQRGQRLAGFGRDASLCAVGALHSAIDFATVEGTRPAVELAWLSDIDGQPAATARSEVQQGNSCFSGRALIQLVKEIVEHCSPDGGPPLLEGELLHVVASINAEHDRPRRLAGLPAIDDVDPESLQRVQEYFAALGQDAIDVERGEMMVDEVASASFERVESLIASIAATHDTWRRNWPAPMPVPVDTHSPAEAFTAAFGVQFDDLLAAGLLILDLAADGVVAFTDDDLISRGASADAVQFVREYMSIDVTKLRREVIRERRRVAETQWLRYTFQRFPFVRLGDGRLLLVKSQFGIQRFFGGLLYWEVWSKLGGPQAQAANDFQRAMAHVFEQRVGEVIKRIAASPALNGAATVANEDELVRALRTGANRPSTCDWVLASGRLVVTIDANNRVLHQPFAERTGSLEEFRNDIGHNLIGDVADSGKTKLDQLASTIALLRAKGGLSGRFDVADDTLWVPLVAVPDGGLPYTALVDYEVVTRARTIDGLLTRNVLPPAIVSLSDLHLLHGVAEHYNRSPIELLALWRQTVAAGPLPITLQDFMPAVGIVARPFNRRLLALGQRVRDELTSRRVTGT